MARVDTEQAKSAIDRAITLLMPQAQAGSPQGTGHIQASDARTVLDTLVASDPATLLSGELNLRRMTESLFDWHGAKRSTKPLLHAMHNALLTPGRYDHAVELTAFLSALSPLLEADRLARLYSLASRAENVYAPVRYTVSLANKLRSVLGDYQPARIEQLAETLWIDAHSGRWWDMTDGVPLDEDGEPIVADEAPQDAVEQLIETGRATWTPRAAERFACLPYNKAVHEIIRTYVRKANSGDDVDPDLSVLAASLSWLPILDRPESPIAPLINTLQSIREAMGELYEAPAKPKRFRDLFPDVRFYGDKLIFPHHPEVLRTHGMMAHGIRFELVMTAAQLQANREYMGNCTWSYKGQMEKGTYALYRLHVGETIYNASMAVQAKRWQVREVNGRFNRGGVPDGVRDTFAALARGLSTHSAAEAEAGSEAAAVRIRARFSVL